MKLKEIRESKGYSQMDIARLSGLSLGSISRMENGGVVNRISFTLVCSVLGVSPNEVTGVVVRGGKRNVA